MSQIAFSVRASSIAQRSVKREIGESAAYDCQIDTDWDLTPLDDRSTHKPTCRADERSSGLYKLVRMFSVNPVLMGYLKCGIVFECGLLDNPRIGFDTPFLARVEIAIEPSDPLNFGGLYVNDPTVEEKLEGIMQAPLTPRRLNTWREARARYDNAEGFAEDPVGLVEFIGHRCTDDSTNSMTAELHIPKMTLLCAMTRAPFTSVSAITGIQTKKPLSAASCLELVLRFYIALQYLTITVYRFINSHIRADKQNQLFLRTEMTEEDKEVIRAAGRNEDTFSVRILKEKMEREQLYAGFLQLTRPVVTCECPHFRRCPDRLSEFARIEGKYYYESLRKLALYH
ncbi:hypothetical protein C8R48DRAFT_779907 [Suillus tomentosus]|nr:hypothetical protein C8R48DRAFT_779907 [Suillus tomentosus]